MSLFGKKDEEHAGSGVDKAHPKTFTEKVSDALKTVKPAREAPKSEPQNDPLQVIPPAD